MLIIVLSCHAKLVMLVMTCNLLCVSVKTSNNLPVGSKEPLLVANGTGVLFLT